jgi:hypothetical protein
MNTVGAAALSAKAYMFMHLHMYTMLYCTYTVYLYYASISAFVRTKKSTLLFHNAM